MTRFATILCPIDFSKPSEVALQHAEEIARTFGSIRSGVQYGSQTRLITTLPTPGNA